MDRRGVLDQAWFLPGSEPARAVSPRNGTGAFIRLPTRTRRHLEAGLVGHRRCGAVSSVRLRRLHQPGTHAVGNQAQQPQRIRASATQHRQPPRRCSRTRAVEVTDTAVEAILDIDSGTQISSDSAVEVHSRSAIGEQYLDFVPSSDTGSYLRDGDNIPASRVKMPHEIAGVIDRVNSLLASVPEGDVRALVSEFHTSVDEIGPTLSSLLESSSSLLETARAHQDETTELLANARPVLEAVADSSPSLARWAQETRDVAAQLAAADEEMRDLIVRGSRVSEEVTALTRGLRPTLPVLAANLVSLGQVAVTYNPSIEQTVVLLPALMSVLQTMGAVDKGNSDRGFISFNLNLNNPEPCTTGFLPPDQRRSGAAMDTPQRTDSPIFCAVPQDSPVSVRGARNLPCMENPGRRAPTVEMCQSAEGYQPQGTNPWVGDPTPTTDNPLADAANTENAQHLTDIRSGTSPQQQIPVATVDQRTGTYTGPDGEQYRLRQPAPAANADANGWEQLFLGGTR